MKYLYTIIFVLFTFHVQSQTPQELVRLVEERTPLIKIFLEEQSTAEADLRQSKVLGNPVLTFQGGEVRSAGAKGSVLDVSLMQPLPWPGRREASIKQQEFFHEISKMNLSEIKIELGHRIFLLAFQLASANEIEAHNKERRQKFNLISRYLGSRPLASPRQILEKDLILSQLRRVEKSMNEATALKRSLEQEIMILTGLREIKINVDWGKLPEGHDKNFYSDHFNKGLRFQKAREGIKISETKIESARLAARPDIMVGVNYRQENIVPANHFYHGQVSVVIPIVDRGQHAVQSARASLRRDEAQLRLLGQTIRSELELHFESFIAARKNIEVFPLNLKEQSEARFRKAEEAFRKGQIDVMTFLESDTQVHENIHLIYTSRLEYLNYLSRLEKLVSHKMERE